jgi:hypothetical protein
MFRVLLTLPVFAVAAPAVSPHVLLSAAHVVVDAMLVVTPAMFIAGAGFQLLRRTEA